MNIETKNTFITPEISKSELCFMSAPTGPTDKPCFCTWFEFSNLCRIEDRDFAKLFFDSLSDAGWNLHHFSLVYPKINLDLLQIEHPMLYNWIRNCKHGNFGILIKKYNKFAKEIGLKEF